MVYVRGRTARTEAIRRWVNGDGPHPDSPAYGTSLSGYVDMSGYYHGSVALPSRAEPKSVHGFTGLERAPYTYLGSPYAKYAHGLDEAARIVTMCAGVLMSRGWRIYCPIAHGHAVTRYQDLPRTWEFWKDQDQPFIDAATDLIVLKMEGWQDSVGLTYEIGEFERTGRPISYIEPRSLGVWEIAQ